MKLVKFFKNKASEQARIGQDLVLDDAADILKIGRENGFRSFTIMDDSVEFLEFTGIEVETYTPTVGAPRVAKKQARA